MFSFNVSTGAGQSASTAVGRWLHAALAVALMIGALLAGGSGSAAAASPMLALGGDAPVASYQATKRVVASQVVLRYAYQKQETGYWCSAAAARIALSVRGKYVSQGALAQYMRVSPSIGLPNINNLRDALNYYTGTRYYETKQLASDAALRKSLRYDVLYNVSRGHAVVINVTRIAGARFAGHYATIVGYSRNGAEYLISDPASASRWAIWLGADDVASGVKLRRYVA